MIQGNPAIEADTSFPYGPIMLIRTRLIALDAELDVHLRPTQITDRDFTICLVPDLWRPNEDSYEMGRFTRQPTIQRYPISVQCLTLDMDETVGLQRNAAMASNVRRILYADEPLRVGFGALSVTSGGATERAQKWGVTQQKFLSNIVDGQFAFMSILDFWFETELK